MIYYRNWNTKSKRLSQAHQRLHKNIYSMQKTNSVYSLNHYIHHSRVYTYTNKLSQANVEDKCWIPITTESHAIVLMPLTLNYNVFRIMRSFGGGQYIARKIHLCFQTPTIYINAMLCSSISALLVHTKFDRLDDNNCHTEDKTDVYAAWEFTWPFELTLLANNDYSELTFRELHEVIAEIVVSVPR